MEMKRLTIAEAALELGVTPDIIRRRISKLELVACQAPEYRECVWIQESSVPTSTRSSSMERGMEKGMEKGKQKIEKVPKENQGGDRSLETASLAELKRWAEAIQERIDELESKNAGSASISRK
jgi:hypothetical protein